jgi:HEPN domain-containing protein
MPPKDELVRAWLVKAQRDLVVARYALTGNPSVPEAACFHAQQAVEKALKATLVAREIEPPRTHVVEVLLSRCGPLDPRFELLAPRCAWLTQFALAGRYPDVGPEPSLAQALEALDLAEQAVRIIAESLPPEVRP